MHIHTYKYKLAHTNACSQLNLISVVGCNGGSLFEATRVACQAILSVLAGKKQPLSGVISKTKVKLSDGDWENGDTPFTSLTDTESRWRGWEDRKGERKGEEGKSKEWERQYSEAKQYQGKNPQKIHKTTWKIKRSKGSQRFKTWCSETCDRTAVCDLLGIGEWGVEKRRTFCYFSLSWSIWFTRPCSLNTLPCLFSLSAAVQIHV